MARRGEYVKDNGDFHTDIDRKIYGQTHLSNLSIYKAHF